uniref:chitinase n=1 Tax=Sphaeramia orbicularis TaxID=375764 RepID=A0A672Y9D7_9TELE
MTNWAQYRPGGGRFTPGNIDPFLCTHVIYALATINSFNQITTIEWNDEQQFAQLNALKRINPDLKTLLAVGGNVNGMSPFIGVVSTPQNRAAFIRSTISYLRTHNFDGINLAWEYPAHNGSPLDDKRRFTMLVQEMDKAFVDDAKDTRKTQLLLAANVASSRPVIERAYEVNQIASFLHMLSMDTGSFSLRSSPMFYHQQTLGLHQRHDNATISLWLALGAPANKLLLGLPSYGRTFRLSTGNSGLGAPANGPADAGPYTRTPGFWSYYEICSFLPGAISAWIPDQEVPYATYGSAWVGYDDPLSFSTKVQYLTALGLGGAHVWTLDMDDFSGSFCSAGAYPLINTARLAMGFPPKPTTTPAPTTTRDPVTGFCHGRPDGLYANEADRTTFFQCFQGNTVLHRCQPGLVFWDSCKCCNWP